MFLGPCSLSVYCGNTAPDGGKLLFAEIPDPGVGQVLEQRYHIASTQGFSVFKGIESVVLSKCGHN